MTAQMRLIAAAVFAATSLGAQAPLDTNFTRTQVMIPMRDGTRLSTVIIAPQNAGRPLPMLMERTPYGVDGPIEFGEFAKEYADLVRDGYIFVWQDIRGRYQSEGTFVMNRPQHTDAKGVDESTDTYDTIEWLVHHVQNTNGRVGIMGVSYPGWLAAVAGIGAHPALKAISPQAPMGDTWMGDDFFHQGAFRLTYGTEYSWELEASKDGSVTPNPGRFDTYEWYLGFPTLGAMADAIGAQHWPTWQRFVAHPTYDAEWRQRSLANTFPHTTIPTLVVGGWWDQEDEYGPLLTYRTLERTDTARLVSLVMGPWYHGQWENTSDSGTTLGNLRVARPTGYDFRALQAKWFAHWLHDSASGTVPAATVFDAGTSEWRTFTEWPAPKVAHRHLYFAANRSLDWAPRESRCWRRSLYIGPNAPGTVPAPSRRAHLLEGLALAPLGDRRSAVRRRAAGCADVADGAADARRNSRWQRRRASLRVDDRHRRGLDREADRRLSGHGTGSAGHGWV